MATDPSGKFTVADMKRILAEHGQTLQPGATVKTVKRPKPGESGTVVVLDRVRDGEVPEYCLHGYASCVSCLNLCWLGHETEKLVASGEVWGMCVECAAIQTSGEPTGRVNDHLRKDGPHE